MKSAFSQIQLILKGRSGVTATIQTFLVKIFILSINMATGIITARMLGAEGRGELAAITLWPQFLAYTMTLGLPKSLLYNLKSHPEKQSDLFSTAFLMSIVLGCLASAVGIIFIPQWLSQYSDSTIQTSQWFMLVAPWFLINIVFVAAFEARNEFTIANQLRYLVPLLTLGGLLLITFLGGASPVTFALVYTLPNVPIGIWMLIRLWPRYKPRLQPFRNIRFSTKNLLDYGLRSYGIDLIGTLSGRIGQAMVVGLLTASSLGLYTVAISLSRVLNTFEMAINTVLLPKAAARPLPEIIALTGLAVRISFFLTFLCVIPLMFGGPWVLSILYGEEFLDAVPVFRVLLVEVLFSGMNWMLAQTFMASGKPGLVTILQMIGLGITIPVMLLLIPIYGLLGAGLALLTSTLIRSVLIFISYPLVLKVSPPSIILTYGDLKYVKQALLRR